MHDEEHHYFTNIAALQCFTVSGPAFGLTLPIIENVSDSIEYFSLAGAACSVIQLMVSCPIQDNQQRVPRYFATPHYTASVPTHKFQAPLGIAAHQSAHRSKHNTEAIMAWALHMEYITSMTLQSHLHI